jgi:hypothetical protein
MWCKAGVIEQSIVVPNVYCITEKGRAMVRALCNTPEPRCVWVDASGKELTDIVGRLDRSYRGIWRGRGQMVGLDAVGAMVDIGYSSPSTVVV